MTRINPITPEKAQGKTAELYKNIQSNLGAVPQIFQALGSTPAVIEAYFTMGGAAKSLSAAEKEAIALTVGQSNSCHYCLAAHTFIGKKMGLTEEETIQNRLGTSTDAKRSALLQLVSEFVREKGYVSEKTYETFLNAGYKAEQLPEIALIVAQNIFTNYFNHLNKTIVDLPEAPQLKKAS